jgi:folate-dependent phosphoribosylglycinamide formyltransferase PurN
MSRVIVLAGHRRSLASILLLARLARQQVRPTAVLCSSEWTLRRVRGWYRRYRGDLLAKMVAGLGLSRGGQFDHEREVLQERLQQLDVPQRHLAELCKQLHVPLHFTSDINDNNCRKLVEMYQPDFAIYSGGGILRESFLKRVRRGVLNMHLGPLPHIRGMNAVEWSLYFGLVPTATLHYIDPGIDTGPILAARTLDVHRGEALGLIRGRAVVAGIELLTEHFADIVADKCPPQPNPRDLGRQYFSMAPPLKDLIQRWLDAGLTPVARADQVGADDLRPAPQRFHEAGAAR